LKNEKSTFVESAVSSPLALMENAEYETFELRISQGNKFILYSDGVTEAFNNKHKQFGEERLLQSASQNSVKTAKLLVEKIVSDVKKHAGDIEQSDDIVVLTIRWLAVPADTQTIQVSNDSDEYPKVLAALYDFCHEHHIPNETRGNLQLILEESVINVMSYAYPKGVEGLIEVLFKANSEWFSITLVDSGKAFNPLQKDINLKVENKEWENGGMGISIFKELTDKIDYNHTDESNHLEMWVKIN